MTDIITGQDIKPGMLVHFRHRQWVVLPSNDKDIIQLKPIGGSDAEATAVYRPLQIPSDIMRKTEFQYPTEEDLADFQSAKILYNAAKLSFRNACGPFRCMGKLSFRPRSYQVVPLVMALKQNIVRLLIADDVGIGKTIEALMILKELMERGEIERFTIICLPHLCEQWQKELKDKLDIEAEIIRSSTIATLERKLHGDTSIFKHYPYQVISIDYIKLPDKMGRREMFISDCPELVIVDEVHTCARPAGKGNQLRFELLKKIADHPNRHLVLLTATPHSGKDDEFQSIIGLLKPEFFEYDISEMNESKRKKLARYFVQRKRENLKRWRKNSGEKNPFPDRESKEIHYNLSNEYLELYNGILDFARGLSTQTGAKIKNSSPIKYWAALALLRGVMSSPVAGLNMLQNRKNKIEKDLSGDEEDFYFRYSLFDKELNQDDSLTTSAVNEYETQETEDDLLESLARKTQHLVNNSSDNKLSKAISVLSDWIKGEDAMIDGAKQKIAYNPIVFCKYIQTAKYVGEALKNHFKDKVQIIVATSELADEQRRDLIASIHPEKPRVLVATDCLSEGINLQELFTAILHYDLPWNPNRIEQRDGRVDRFGQESPRIKTYILLGENNEVDQIVWNVLIKKIYEIRNSIGVNISIGDDDSSVMEGLIKRLITGENKGGNQQLSLFADDYITNVVEKMRQKAENLRSIFAHENVSADEIEKELKEVDDAIGDIPTVASFVTSSIIALRGNCTPCSQGYKIDLTNLPQHLKSAVPKEGKHIIITFESPTPAGLVYIGRNHKFVELLCQFMLSLAIDNDRKTAYPRVARSAIVLTDKVTVRTTLIQFRVRNVIQEVNSKRQVIAEEVFLWGYAGSNENSRILSEKESMQLLFETTSVENIPIESQKREFGYEQPLFSLKAEAFEEVARKRAEHLVEAHGRFRTLVGGKSYETVVPVLPPDILGVYILKPVAKALF
ncbi:MAG: DEAD/DEAH box helicase [Prevotellaceae bacterium]|jgi:superfamily II DNA or RNA helicase|nr:DEAD/DEAH box helicase [Prevotellaceae bacterium]